MTITPPNPPIAPPATTTALIDPNPGSNPNPNRIQMESLKKIEDMMTLVLEKVTNSSDISDNNNINNISNNNPNPIRTPSNNPNHNLHIPTPIPTIPSHPAKSAGPSTVAGASDPCPGPGPELIDIVHELYSAILLKKYKELELSSLLAQP